ncbi:hypothetical protein [Sphingomonas sp. TZW2008]|uniref:hypothetical protein n=1 Tax=Sphingomonas sp. TZW2008 TaxID=1917973 RepID=UPI001181BF26|nr:hypothetical protein [Sphingomonas sp. TZW2008]
MRDGWLFRRHGHGPALPLSDQECAAFQREGWRSVLLHSAALPLLGWLAWLVLERMLPTWSTNAIALIFGVVISLIALALFGSIRNAADAPARRLASRAPVRPAREPDDAMQPSYATIIGLTMGLLFLAAIGTQRTASFYIAFASASVMLGIILAVRRWLFDNRLTALQREQLRARADEQRAARRVEKHAGRSWWKGALLLGFVVVELIFLAGGVLAGIAIVLAISGQTSEQLTFGLFMTGFLPGLALGALAFWPLERLCKRWTGASAVHAFDWIPAGW